MFLVSHSLDGVHFMVPWRIENGNLGSRNDAEKFLVLIMHRRFIGGVAVDRVPAPKEKRRFELLSVLEYPAQG